MGEPSTRLKVYLRGQRLVLSDFMPILENAGLRVIAMSPFDAQNEDEGAGRPSTCSRCRAPTASPSTWTRGATC
jgi:NAD-specific glutamate dehydrogenase